MKANHIQESILREAATAIFRELEQLVGERLYVNMRSYKQKPQWMVSVCPIDNSEDDYHHAIKVTVFINTDTIKYILEDDWFETVKGHINDHLNDRAIERYFTQRARRNRIMDDLDREYGHHLSRHYLAPQTQDYHVTPEGDIWIYPERGPGKTILNHPNEVWYEG